MDAIVIRDTIRPDQISDTASCTDDLGLDSLSLLEIAVDAEMSLHVKIPDERLPELRTVDETVRVVREYLLASARA